MHQFLAHCPSHRNEWLRLAAATGLLLFPALPGHHDFYIESLFWHINPFIPSAPTYRSVHFGGSSSPSTPLRSRRLSRGCTPQGLAAAIPWPTHVDRPG